MLVMILAIVLAMGVSFLCSVMEAAILSINPGKMALLSAKHPRIGKICLELKENIERPIAVILILNTTAHTFGAAIAGAQFDKLYGSDYIWLFSLVFTALMVQYTEILPKTLGVRFNSYVVAQMALPLKISIKLVQPIIWLIHLVNRPFEGRDDENKTPNGDMEDELDALASMAREANCITPTQEQAIRSIPDLKDDAVGMIMTSRSEMAVLRSDMNMNEILAVASKTPHSRYPVVDAENDENYIGVLNVRDLLFLSDSDWLKLLKKPLYIKESEVQLKIAENIRSFDTKLLLVTDDNDRVSGMITTNNLVMRLFPEENAGV